MATIGQTYIVTKVRILATIKKLPFNLDFIPKPANLLKVVRNRVTRY